MPGAWTPEHRAAYDETMRLRREAIERGERPPGRKRRLRSDHGHHAANAHLGCPRCDLMARAEHPEPEAVFDAAALLRDMEDALKRVLEAPEQHDALKGIRGTVLRLEDKMALLQASVGQSNPTADPRLVEALQALNGRVGALERAWSTRKAHEDRVLKLLARLDSRPPRVIEYRPNHRRQSEGGAPIREQRSAAGLPKRAVSKRVERDVDSPR